jgi:hypothetical protein
MAVALLTRRTSSRSHDAPCAMACGKTVTPLALLRPWMQVWSRLQPLRLRLAT